MTKCPPLSKKVKTRPRLKKVPTWKILIGAIGLVVFFTLFICFTLMRYSSSSVIVSGVGMFGFAGLMIDGQLRFISGWS